MADHATRTAAQNAGRAASGSDLHITTDTPPQIRVHGHLQRLEGAGPDAGRHEAAGLQRADRRAEEALRGDARARLLVRHQGAGALPLQHVQPARRRGRRLPADSREDPHASRSWACRRCWRRWPSGRAAWCSSPARPARGKSTTLAAMIDKINKERHDHILTIEDPIEFVHQHQGCLVNQREVHSDTQSFAMALRAALREDPDIVLIGEMRDLETVEVGAAHRRDRPPDVRHAAHELGGADDQPHHRHLPGAPAEPDPHAAVAGARGHRLSGAAAEDRRRPRARRSRSWCRRRPSGT